MATELLLLMYLLLLRKPSVSKTPASADLNFELFHILGIASGIGNVSSNTARSSYMTKPQKADVSDTVHQSRQPHAHLFLCKYGVMPSYDERLS